MGQVRARGEDVRRYIIENVEKFPKDISKKTAARFKISRQAVNKHLRRLTVERFLTEEGETRGRVYKLAPLAEWSKTYVIGALEEDIVWHEDIAPHLGELPDNVRKIWNYGFTEMFNNAQDHSGGKRIAVNIRRTAANTEMYIVDDGVGIFRKIQRAMNLLDERHAILELAKGKLTTDPSNHTGEGIFFTSRMFDDFAIISGGVAFAHEFGKEEDWVMERNPRDGTGVFMLLHTHTSRTMKKIFDRFSSENDDYKFNKTVVPVKLAQYGNDQIVSRSQAKRLLARVELFAVVIFDFKDVPTIGQAFADEIFRVFAQRHPEIALHEVHANSEVRRMIERAKSGVTFAEAGPTEASAPEQPPGKTGM